MTELSPNGGSQAPRHRSKRRRFVSLGGVLTSLGAVSLGTFVALLSVGGTYALWNDESELEGTAITSGILELVVVGTLDSSHWSMLLPGERHVQFVVVENTGNIPLELSALAAQPEGELGSFEVRLELVDAVGGCTYPSPGLDDFGSTVALGVLAPGSFSHLCVDVTLSATALPGDGALFALTLTADQES